MGKGLAIGFLVGALAAGLLFKVLQNRDEAHGDGASTPEGGGAKAGKGGGAGGGGAGVPEELATVRSENATLRAKISDLEAQLAEAKKAAGGARPKTNRLAKWRELSALIAQAKKEADDNKTAIKGDKYFAPLLALIGLVADDLGVPIGEALLSPDWYPMFAQNLLDASPYPLSDEQRAAMDKVVGESRKAWDDFRSKRDSMTPLERAAALRDLQFDMFNGLGPIGSAEQKAYIASLNMPPPNAPYQGVWDGAGPREAVKTNIGTNMAKGLGLDATQVTTLGPVIDDYMRGYDNLQKEIEIHKKAGEPFDDVGAKIQLAMEMQKRIGETVRLSDAQAKALKDWTQVHDYQVKE